MYCGRLSTSNLCLPSFPLPCYLPTPYTYQSSTYLLFTLSFIVLYAPISKTSFLPTLSLIWLLCVFTIIPTSIYFFFPFLVLILYGLLLVIISLSLLHYQYDIISSDLVAISPLSFSFLSPCLLYIPILHLIQRCHLLLYRSASFSHVRTLFYLFPFHSPLRIYQLFFLLSQHFPHPIPLPVNCIISLFSCTYFTIKQSSQHLTSYLLSFYPVQ